MFDQETGYPLYDPRDVEEDEYVDCICYEQAGDNLDCPKHGSDLHILVPEGPVVDDGPQECPF
jgi:hypothetical protein